MIVFSDDPVRDADRHDAEQERWLKNRPICSICGEHIQDDSALYLDDWICDECVDANRKWIID